MLQGAVTISHVEYYSGDKSNIEDARYKHHCAHLPCRGDVAAALQHVMFGPLWKNGRKDFQLNS